MESIALADGQDDKKGRDAIPSILSEALSVSFDNHIGHDYLHDYEERYESYHKKKILSRLIWNISIRLQRVGFRIRHLTLLSLVLVLVSLCLCVMSHLQFFYKERTYYTLPLRWLRRKLRREFDANY